jgi:hypothetical protein
MDYDNFLLKSSNKRKPRLNTNILHTEDKEFYQHRIMDLCARIMLEEYEEPCQLPLNDLIDTFNGFMVEAVKYFKTKDKVDFLQSEFLYESNNDNMNNTNEEVQEQEQEQEKQSVAVDVSRVIPIHAIRELTFLEKHVIKKIEDKTDTTIKSKRECIVFPKEREFDFKNPSLMKKGLLKNNFDIVNENKKKLNEHEETKNECDNEKENKTKETEV